MAGTEDHRGVATSPTGAAAMNRDRAMRRPALITSSARARAAGLARRAPVRFARALIRELNDDDVTGTSAEMAYRFLFAMFPLVLLSAAIFGLVGSVLGREDIVHALVDQVRPFLPAAIAATTDGIVAELMVRAPTYALLGLVATVWGAASGVGALIKGLNRAYDVERPRAMWRRQAISVGIALLAPPAGLALLLVSVIGQSLMTWLGDALGMSGPLAAIVAAFQAIASAAVFFVGMSVIYRALPAVDQRLRDVLPGALVATAAWVLLTQAFGAYVANLEGYRATYGAFAAAISFLLWLYLVSVVVLVGAEINALLLSRGRLRWADDSDPRTIGGDPWTSERSGRA